MTIFYFQNYIYIYLDILDLSYLLDYNRDVGANTNEPLNLL